MIWSVAAAVIGLLVAMTAGIWVGRNVADGDRTAVDAQLGTLALHLNRLSTSTQKLNQSSDRLNDEVRRTLGVDPMPASQNKNLNMNDTEDSDDLNTQISHLSTIVDRLQFNVKKLKSTAEARLQDLARRPTLIPTNGWISSPFGPRLSPFDRQWTEHRGVDIAALPGTPVFAPADGYVGLVGNYGAFGFTVTLNHGARTATRFGHLKRAHVRLGDFVVKGQKIAEVGNSGRATGPHLHYEVVVAGRQVDPLDYMIESQPSEMPSQEYPLMSSQALPVGGG